MVAHRALDELASLPASLLRAALAHIVRMCLWKCPNFETGREALAPKEAPSAPACKEAPGFG